MQEILNTTSRYRRQMHLTVAALLLGSTWTLRAQEVMKVQNGALITVQNGAEMMVQGGLNLENGSTLVNNGTITLRQNGASGAANWTDNSLTPYNYGTGKVVFNGTGGHTVSSPNLFGRIDVDATGHLSLGSDIQAAKWYLVNGKVNTTSAFRAIATDNAQLAVEADAGNNNFSNSWINGKLRRYLSPTTVNSYLFPVGDAAKVNLAVMDNLNANPLDNLTYIDASFGPKPGNDAGLVVSENGQGYIAVNNGGVWYLTPDAAPASGKYDLQLYFNGFSGLLDNTFAIIRRPDASSNAADWSVPAGSVLPANGQPGRIFSPGYARRNNIGGFSQFGIASLSAPLPVSLLSFDARRMTRVKVLVNWETVTEINNRGFEIERRLDAEPAFARIGFEPSKAPGGNSTDRLQYSYTDPNGYAGVSYYRLKQVDIDNRFTYTHIKAVKGMGETQVSVMLYPNPNYGQFTVRIDGVNRSFDAVITDMGGKVVRRLILGNNGAVSVSGLSAGTYIIRIPDVFGEGEAFTEKVMVVK